MHVLCTCMYMYMYTAFHRFVSHTNVAGAWKGLPNFMCIQTVCCVEVHVHNYYNSIASRVKRTIVSCGFMLQSFPAWYCPKLPIFAESAVCSLTQQMKHGQDQTSEQRSLRPLGYNMQERGQLQRWCVVEILIIVHSVIPQYLFLSPHDFIVCHMI